MIKITKTIFIDKRKNVHFGMNAPSEEFKKATLEDVEKVLKNTKNKKFWQCQVCHDLHLGTAPPKECPTCHHIDAYKEITKEEFKKAIGL